MKAYRIPIVLAVIGIFLVRAGACAGENGGADQMLPAVSVELVRTIDKSEAKTYIGTVNGSESVGVVARISGTLWNVAFNEGALVHEGDVLFEIEDTVYKANVRVAEALIKQAEANLVLARKDHERNTNLLAEKAISAQTFDTTLASQMLQEAKVEEAKANLILKQHDLEYCRIISPITGRIGEKLYSAGNYITPSLGVLATVVQYQPIKVQFSMSESDYFRYFTKHDELRDAEFVIVRANGEKYIGSSKVDFVDNSVDRRTDTIMISLECDNPDDQLLPGGFVQVQLAEKYTDPVPAVAVSAFMTDGANHYVYIVTNGDVVERRVVQIGDVVGRFQTVLQGLEPGERVLVGGMNKVVPGTKIKPVMVAQ